MIKVVITGALGKMGSSVVRILRQESDMQLIAGIEATGHPSIGEEIDRALAPDGVPILDTLEEVIDETDCIVDFTNPEAALVHLKVASSGKTPSVVGTTGFSDEEIGRIEAHAAESPCVLAPNMSLGVNLIFRLAEEITLALEDYDCEIVEAHHRQKRDAPSGTARRLAEIIANVKGGQVSEIARYGRRGDSPRAQSEVGVHSIRGGDIVGEHTVLWAGGAEKIELSHTVHSRDAFARGTVAAIRWVVNASPGLYTMEDVLFS
jgi:4-hydroxy-tetrahydrodipicolinate reductase